MDNSKEILALGRTETSAPALIGNRVVDRLLTTDKVIDLPRQKYLFLQLRRRDVSLEDAAVKAKLDLKDAQDFESTPLAQEYLQDRLTASILAEEAKDQDRWWIRLHSIVEGKIPVTREQMDAMKLAGARIAPTSEGQAATNRIEINIDPTAVQEAFRRQNAIEAQIVEERKAG